MSDSILYTTTRQTLVERTPVKSQRVATPHQAKPKFDPPPRNPIVDAAIPLVLCNLDGPAFKQWTEETGLVLTIIRSSVAAAEVHRIVHAAFPHCQS